MSTLLIRLAGPMQSWGTQSRFTVRDTGLEPSKSGVVGLLCAAMGLGRHAAIDYLASLRMGVRVDKEGRMERDYHTAMNVIKASGSLPPKGEAVVSQRYYLADAEFLVGLEGEIAILSKASRAIKNPVWALCLGRKAFPPSEPIWLKDGLQEGIGLEEALTRHPIKKPARASLIPTVRLVLEVPAEEAEAVRVDWPLSFSERHFTVRHVKTVFVQRESLQEQEED